MILDSSGKPMPGDDDIAACAGCAEGTPASHPVEIVRSFSFKLNLGDYQSADFFCSRKEQVTHETVDEISTSIYEWCYEEVMESVREIKAVQAQKRAALAARKAS